MKKCKRHKWCKFPVTRFERFYLDTRITTVYYRREKGKYCFNCDLIKGSNL